MLSIDQIAAAFEGFFWPKIFWDFLTTNLNGAVKPIPVLQIINLLLGILGLAWEWPLSYLSGTAMHRSMEARLVVYPLSSLAALLLYQGTNPGIYYLVGMGVYFWAFSEGEVSLIPCHWHYGVMTYANIMYKGRMSKTVGIAKESSICWEGVINERGFTSN